MDILRAKEIISALAEGIDPMTGEVLPNNHVCNQGEVVRAFYVALNAMGTKKKKQPENAGKPWVVEDEEILRKLFTKGVPKKEICRILKRTENGVAARLVRMGLIDDRDGFIYRP